MNLEMSRRQLAVVLVAPLAIALIVHEVPRFVFAACSYYGACNQSQFSVTATPVSIALNETSALEGFNAQCPCSWQIDSQPGGWQVVAGSNCTATLKPIGTFGSPGTIVVRCNSGQSCSKTVSVQAGTSAIRIQGSINAGTTWNSNTLTVFGKPGGVVNVAFRVLFTATNDYTHGWSYSVRRDAAQLVGGGLELLSVTTAGTHTDTVQQGAAPDFEVTDLRQNGSVELGLAQGVVIDYDMDVPLDSVLNFVSARGCYKLTLPPAGSYQAYLTLTHDLSDGQPPIKSSIVQRTGAVVPALRGLTIQVYSHSSYTTPAGNCTATWTTSSDGLPGPDLPDGGGAAPGPAPPMPPIPFSCGDADASGVLDIADPIYVLLHLFQGGTPPCQVALPGNILKTRQSDCFEDDNGPPVTCPPDGQPFFGQDGHYQTGLARSYVDNGDGTISDLVTRLVWEKEPEAAGHIDKTFSVQGAIAHCENLEKSERDDWRLPSVAELFTIMDYSRFEPAADPLFVYPPPTGVGNRYWSSTLVALDNNFGWYINCDEGHTDPRQLPAGLKLPARCVCDLDRPRPEGPAAPIAPFDCGNFDGQAPLDLTDAVNILTYLFLGGPPPCVVDRPLFQLEGSSYVDNLDGTVTDQRTGLVWLKQPENTELGWEAALAFVENGTFADIEGGWRLPNVYELTSLIDFDKTTSPVVHEAFTLPISGNGSSIFWASTTSQGRPHRAWAVDFTIGQTHNDNLSNEKVTSMHFVWPVRGGQ